MVFASTSVKREGTPADYYVEALVGGDVQTNPPDTLDALVASGKSYERSVETLPSDEVCAEIDEKVDMDELERVLVEEGIKKFADPQRELLEALKAKRKETIGA
jgi:transaldolase